MPAKRRIGGIGVGPPDTKRSSRRESASCQGGFKNGAGTALSPCFAAITQFCGDERSLSRAAHFLESTLGSFGRAGRLHVALATVSLKAGRTCTEISVVQWA